MEAYTPIAYKVYGNPHISTPHKKSFLRSLFNSRLLFNVHITVPGPRDLVAYNNCYMRPLRRVVGDMRFSHDVEHSDLEIRRLLSMPSIECLIAKSRLLYARRLLKLRPRALLGVLHLRKGGGRLPWVQCLAHDCDRLRVHQLVPAHTASFFDDPAGWHGLMLSERWPGLVDKLFFAESVTDRKKTAVDSSSGRQLACACSRCDCSFATHRALESHARAKHGDRLLIKRFVHGTVCPCCGTDYRDRLRLVAHLSDRRRPHCATWVMANVQPLPDSKLQALDAADRKARTDAQRAGLTHPRAFRPARRADGRVIGRTQA